MLKSSDLQLIFRTSRTLTLAEMESVKTDVRERLNASPPAGWLEERGGMGWGVTAYRSAKTGLNMLMRDWMRVFREDGVKV